MNILERLRQRLRRRPPAAELRMALTQELHTTALSPSYRLVHLAVTLHNLSDQETRHYHVLTAALAQVAPLTDQEIKDLIQQDQDRPIRDGSPRYPWPPLPPGVGPHPALPATIPANSRQTCHFSFQIPAETTCVEATVLLQTSNPTPALPYGQPRQSWQNIGIYDLPPTPGKDRQNPPAPESEENQS